MRLSASELAAAAHGVVHGDPATMVDGAAIDSRQAVAGRLFVPVVAERDGHDFIAAAVAGGAAAYLTSRPVPADGPTGPHGGATAIEVADTTVALAQIAHAVRRRISGPVVGVTGSVGKTTVKDLLAGTLGTTLRTAANERSFNNELGVPLTLCNVADDVEAVVVEMGARGKGHVQILCEVAAPTIGVLTRVAASHTETFGSLDDVAAAKAELVASLPPSGTAVLNADDPRVLAMADDTRARVLTYGQSAVAEVTAEALTFDEALRPRFTVRTPWGAAGVAVPAAGEHQVANALAALAAALAVGVELEVAAAALATATLSPWRMEVHRTSGGATVVNDAYNANPASMEAALRSLAALPALRRFAVLGRMAELGADSGAEHRRMVELATELGITVVAVGTDQYGLAHLEGPEAVPAALEALAGPLGPSDAVLVKGSRVVGLERAADLLLGP